MHTCRHRRGSCGSCRLGGARRRRLGVFVRVGLRCGRLTLAQRFDRESRCLPFRGASGYTAEVGLVTVPSNRGHGILGLNFVASLAVYSSHAVHRRRTYGLLNIHRQAKYVQSAVGWQRARWGRRAACSCICQSVRNVREGVFGEVSAAWEQFAGRNEGLHMWSRRPGRHGCYRCVNLVSDQIGWCVQV